MAMHDPAPFHFLPSPGSFSGLSFFLLHAQSISFPNAPEAAQALKKPMLDSRSHHSDGKGAHTNLCASELLLLPGKCEHYRYERASLKPIEVTQDAQGSQID